MCPGENGRLGEEQIGMVVEHASDPSKRVLIDEAVEAPHHLLQGVENVIEYVDGEAGIRRRQGSDVLTAPHGCRSRREGHGVG